MTIITEVVINIQRATVGVKSKLGGEEICIYKLVCCCPAAIKNMVEQQLQQK